MKIRRCAVLYIEPRETLGIDWTSMFSGGATLAATLSWVALAPHLGRELVIEDDDLKILGAIGHTIWTEQEVCEQRFGHAAVARLLALGLLIGDDEVHHVLRERDDTLRSQQWRPLSALAHTFSRWEDVRIETGMQIPSYQELVEKHGQPPPLTVQRSPAEHAVKLPPAPPGALDDTLFRRYTGRNFDVNEQLPAAVVARLLQRTFGAQELRKVGEDGYVFKKLSPSGGALHPIEAYVMVQRVEGIAPGLYHYHPLQHTLEPVQLMDAAAAAALARQLVADQYWFSDAPLLVVMAARVERNYWKYRNHLKAYKAIILDGGHLSQNFYMLATEAGLSAFITAAVNDVDIERALGLDHLRDAVIAVCGCGSGSGRRETVELRFGEEDAA